jgi:hypothetical protein
MLPSELIGDLKGFFAGVTKLDLNTVQLGSGVSDLVLKNNRARLPFLFRSPMIHQGLVFEKG